MYEVDVTVNSKRYRRVQKTEARNMFNSGNKIYILPYKLRFNNAYIVPCLLQKNQEIKNFDKFINNYEYYMCTYQVGNYCAYYVEVE